MADGAVDVVERAALAAHDVVVVVSRAALVARGVARRLDAAQETGVAQGVQHVVDALDGHGRELLAHGLEDGLGGRVGEPADDVEHREPWRRDA